MSPGIKDLCRQILVGAYMAGGKTTRGELGLAMRQLAWRPTRGEMTTALEHLEHEGRLEVVPASGSYRDFSDARISLTP